MRECGQSEVEDVEEGRRSLSRTVASLLAAEDVGEGRGAALVDLLRRRTCSQRRAPTLELPPGDGKLPRFGTGWLPCASSSWPVPAQSAHQGGAATRREQKGRQE